MENSLEHLTAVIGAGPAGLFAARELAQNGVRVALINRDIKPGGLAEYGIYPDKHRMKDGLRAQFQQVLTNERIHYFGNVQIHQHSTLSMDGLRSLGFQVMLVTAGAQGTKWLGLPGEELKGVFHAKDLVYHYNNLPPFSEQKFDIGQRIAVIGVGNVMVDVSHYLIEDLKVQSITALARRGPGEIKFDKKELETIARHLDLQAFDADIERLADTMYELGQNPAQPKALVHDAVARAKPGDDSDSRFRIRFLVSPVRILGDARGNVCGLVVEHNALVEERGRAKAVGTGKFETLDVDTVVFAIGDKVDEGFGLPVDGSEFTKSSRPLYPIEGVSYEVYDAANDRSLPGIFVAGWARQASTGLVGVARKDGTNGARAVLAYLDSLPLIDACASINRLKTYFKERGYPVVTQKELNCLDRAEKKHALEMGIEHFKFRTNEEMRRAIRRECGG